MYPNWSEVGNDSKSAKIKWDMIERQTIEQRSTKSYFWHRQIWIAIIWYIIIPSNVILIHRQRAPYFSYVLLDRVPISKYYKYGIFFVLRHLVTTLGTAFNNSYKFINDFFIILKSFNNKQRSHSNMEQFNKWLPTAVINQTKC